MFRGGIAWDQTPVVYVDRTPRLPDEDRWWFSFGTQYKWSKNLKIDAGFTYIIGGQGADLAERRQHERERADLGPLRRRRHDLLVPGHLHVLAVADAGRPRAGPRFPAAAASGALAPRPLRRASRPAFRIADRGSTVPRSTRRRPRRRRHGRADRGALRQRRHPGGSLRPDREGRRPARHRAPRHRRRSRSSTRRRSPRASSPRTSRPPTTAPTSTRLAGCDLVIEAIAERLDWKRDLYAKVAPHLAPHAILASNTSGLSLAALDDALPEALRSRFCGIHFFNPPRYMHLVELIASPSSDPRDARRARGVPDDRARQGRDPREGHAELRRQPHRRVLGDRDDGPHAAPRPRLRRGRRADRAGDRPREERDLPHRRRRRARHAGARHRDDARHAARRSLASPFRRAPGARRARREGRARPEDEGRVLPQAGPRDRGARPGRRRLPRERGRGRSRGRGDPRASSIPARSSASSARIRIRRRSSCGRSSATRSTTARTSSRRSRTTRATSTSRSAGASAGRSGPFETWQAAGWAEVAGWIAEDIAAGKTLADVPLPAWVQRRQGDRREGRARARRRVLGGADRVRRALHAAGVPPPALPGSGARRALRPRHDRVRDRRGAHVAPGARRRDRLLQDQAAHDQRRGARRRAARARRGRARLRRPRDLAAEGAVLVRREPGLARARRAGRPLRLGRGGGGALPADLAAAARQPGADRRGGARHGARRLLRVHHALRPRGRRARVLRRTGRGRRRTCCPAAAGRRSSRCARPRRRSAGRSAARPTTSPSSRPRSRPWRPRRSRRARSRRRRSGFLRPADVVVMHAARDPARRDRAGARAGRRRLSPAAAAGRDPGRRRAAGSRRSR